MKEPKIVTTATGGIDTKKIPEHVGYNIARVAFSGILRAYNDPIIQEDYKRWKAEREAAQNGQAN